MASSTFKNTNSGADKQDGVEYENFETPDRCGKRKETCTPCEESPEAKKVKRLLCQDQMSGTITPGQSRAVTGAFATTARRCFHVLQNQELPISRSTCSSAESTRRT